MILALSAVALFAADDAPPPLVPPVLAVEPEEFSAATDAYQIAGILGAGATAALGAWAASGGLGSDPRGAAVRAVAAGLWAAFGGYYLGRAAAHGAWWARAAVWVLGVTGGVIVVGVVALIAVSGTVREVFTP